QQVSNVLERIKRAAELSSRSLEDITLIAVSKNRSIDAIKSVYQCGIRHFCESKAAEWEEKVLNLFEYPDIKWNFIGTIEPHANIIAAYNDIAHTISEYRI